MSVTTPTHVESSIPEVWARMTFRVKEAFAEVSREVSRRFGGPM